MRKLLALPRYDASGPSSRYRLYQFLPGLRECGWDVSVDPLLAGSYVECMYAGKPWGKGRLARSFAWRLARLAQGMGRHDALWIEKECLPWLPEAAEWILARTGVPFAVDYDDAIFHSYDCHPSPAVRAFLGRKIDKVMALSGLVVAGNAYLAERASEAGARRVEVLPTVVDLARYPEPALSQERAAGPLRVGWIGSPVTENYLQAVIEPMREVCGRFPMELVVIGGSEGFSIPGVPTRRVQWSEHSEVTELSKLDLGIMPLPDNPWSWGKCGFKLIQYMGVGLPVIASPIGVNRDLVSHGANGFLAGSAKAWRDSLIALAEDTGLRERMGKEGRRRMVANYTIQAIAPRLEGCLATLAGVRPMGGQACADS